MIKTVIAASALVIADPGITDFFRTGGPRVSQPPKAQPATFAASE